jgi:transposase
VPRTRTRYTAEYKAEVVQLVRTSNKSVAEVSRDLGINKGSIHEWLRQAAIDSGKREGLTTAEREELLRARREIKVLREERDILRKAAAFFAAETR